jgi:hypothetical protein
MPMTKRKTDKATAEWVEIKIVQPEPQVKPKRVVVDERTAPLHARLYRQVLSAIEEAEQLGFVQEDPAWRAIAASVRMHEPTAAHLVRVTEEQEATRRGRT